MKKTTLLLTLLLSLMFGQTAVAQLGVKLSDDNVRYEYYIKRLADDKKVSATQSTGEASMYVNNGGTAVKFIFKKASTTGNVILYSTNIIKNNDESFAEAPLYIATPNNTPTYYTAAPKPSRYGVPAEFNLGIVECNSGKGNYYALKVGLTKASGGANITTDNTWNYKAPSTNASKVICYVAGGSRDQYSLWLVEAAAPAPMVFSNATAGTLATYSSALDAAIPEGVKAYRAASSTANSNNEIELEEIQSTSYIPAGVGVIIEQTGTSQYYTVSSPTSGQSAAGASALKATTLAQTSAPDYTTSTLNSTSSIPSSATGSIVVTNSSDLYGLGTVDGTQAFYHFEGYNTSGSTVTLPAYKAYLQLTASSTTDNTAIKLKFPDGSTTSINGVNVGEKISNAAIYDLSGRRVNATTKGNLYIQNGKKFVAQ